MRVTIVPDDGFVSKDGVGYSGVTFSIDSSIHAVQWYGTYGEVEFKVVVDGVNITKQQNSIITDFSMFQNALDCWESANKADEEKIRNAKADAAIEGNIAVNPDALPA